MFELKRVSADCCDALLAFELENAQFFSEFVSSRPPEMLTPKGMLRAIERLEGDMAAQKGLYLVAARADEIVGRLNFTIDGNQAELGYRVAQKYGRQGVAGRMLAKGIELLAKEYKVDRLIGRAMTSNPASTRVLERSGFKAFDVEIDGGVKRNLLGDMVLFERRLDQGGSDK